MLNKLPILTLHLIKDSLVERLKGSFLSLFSDTGSQYLFLAILELAIWPSDWPQTQNDQPTSVPSECWGEKCLLPRPIQPRV